MSNHIHFEDPACEIPPLTFKFQFHLHYMVLSRCQNFPNDKHSGKTWEHTKSWDTDFIKERIKSFLVLKP